MQVAGIPLAVVKLLLRFVLIAGILAYLAAAAGLLATRYWLLPRIDQWRPEIQQALSEAVGTPVRFDQITAEWRGLNANLRITNLTILDDQGVAQLGVPATDAIVSWRSLFALEPVFRYVGVDEVILVARRSPEAKIYVAGFEVDLSDDSHTSFWQSATMRWLRKQGRLNIQNSRLVWVDQLRNAVPLVLEDIDITVDNGLLGHKLDLKATMGPELGGTLELAAQINSITGSLSGLLVDKPDGYLYVSVSEIYPQALSPWVEMPGIDGSFGARAWFDLFDGKFTNFNINLAGRDASLKSADSDDDSVRLSQFRWQASGPLALLGADRYAPSLIEHSKTPPRVASSLTLEKASFKAPMPGMRDVVADQLSAEVSLTRSAPDSLRVDVRELVFANADGLITARGSWASDTQDKGGLLDIEGTLARFKLPNLHHYLPDTIGEDAHQWLSTAFKSGTVPRASFQIAGLVDDFPYSAGRGEGTFRIDGTVQDWSVDYSPVSDVQELPWPLLTGMNGTLMMLNDRIAVDIASGALTLPKGERISLAALSAELVDLEGDALLTVKGKTNALAQDYLALFKDTALREIAPEFVRDFNGAGDWSMPLTLRVPLNDVDGTTFSGELAFNGGTVTYAASPPLSELDGVALLSETGFEARGLSAKLLDGRIELAGGLNDKLDTITGKGDLSWPALAQFAGSELMGQWLKGRLAYELKATVKDEKFEVSLASDLRGTQIDLPAPMGLQAGQAAAMRLGVRGELTGSAPYAWTLNVADRLAMGGASVNAEQTDYRSFFKTMGIALGAAQPVSGNGLTIAVNVPAIELENWMPVVDELSKSLQGPTKSGPAVFPELTTATLRSKQFVMGGNRFENVTADLAVRNSRQYTVKLNSNQTSGTVQWALDKGKLQDGYIVRLDKLVIGSHDDGQKTDPKKADLNNSPLPEPGALSNLPALDVEIEDLTIYGSRLGQFRLVGRNTSNQQQWQINKLQIVNPHAQLTASGTCRFNDNPGVTLEADLNIADLGELTVFMGKGEQVRKGRGTVTGKIEWTGFPWRFDYAGLSGQADLKLEEGVFDHVNSSSARVLELLSMQSLNRILDANINPAESFQQGFPWSSITGDFLINRGVVDTQNLTVNSPVATISLTGDSSLVSETWDLEAVVRPNLDMSGAALATGFLINPIVGLSALVGQYLLRNPVESALSQRYHVGGSWDDPKIVEGANPKNQAEQQNRQPEVRN